MAAPPTLDSMLYAAGTDSRWQPARRILKTSVRLKKICSRGCGPCKQNKAMTVALLWRKSISCRSGLFKAVLTTSCCCCLLNMRVEVARASQVLMCKCARPCIILISNAKLLIHLAGLSSCSLFQLLLYKMHHYEHVLSILQPIWSCLLVCTFANRILAPSCNHEHVFGAVLNGLLAISPCVGFTKTIQWARLLYPATCTNQIQIVLGRCLM